MTLKFIKIETEVLTDYPRDVTLEYNTNTKMVHLLGALKHNTQIIIDQRLVDDLQSIVDHMCNKR
jgi:hypothetical protein